MWKSAVDNRLMLAYRSWWDDCSVAEFEKHQSYAIITPDMPKRTYQPHKRSRAKVHGFRARMSSRAGRLVLKRRRNKQRAKVAI